MYAYSTSVAQASQMTLSSECSALNREQLFLCVCGFALCLNVQTSCSSLSKTKPTILLPVQPHLRLPRVTNTSPADSPW